MTNIGFNPGQVASRFQQHLLVLGVEVDVAGKDGIEVANLAQVLIHLPV